VWIEGTFHDGPKLDKIHNSIPVQMLGWAWDLLMGFYLSSALMLRGLWSQYFASVNRTLRKHPIFHFFSRILISRKKPSNVPHLDDFGE
jgi:hypothetical protein